MKDQPNVKKERIGGRAGEGKRISRDALLPGVVGLAFLLVGVLWASSYFSLDARMRRATVRVVELVEKTGEESPVSLGLAANRLGALLTPDTELGLEEVGELAQGRAEVVQLFAHIRSSMSRISFSRGDISVAVKGRGEVLTVVRARYRFEPATGDPTAGEGTAELHWVRGDEGWRIRRSRLNAGEDAAIPKGWL